MKKGMVFQLFVLPFYTHEMGVWLHLLLVYFGSMIKSMRCVTLIITYCWEESFPGHAFYLMLL